MVFCKIASFHARSRSSQAAGLSGRRESSGLSIFKQTKRNSQWPSQDSSYPKSNLFSLSCHFLSDFFFPFAMSSLSQNEHLAASATNLFPSYWPSFSAF